MRKLSVLAAVTAVLGLAAPSRAAGVTLEVHAGHFLAPPAVACAVTVPDGADGIAVLDKAVQTRCISSYRVKHFSFGDFVYCINDICQTDDVVAALTWVMSENDRCTDYGVNGFAANQGDRLQFTYSTWAILFAC